ncbi:MAG TPA: heavy metal translocating P-type ATPase [Alphaproteobacteria bacterium]|nr:heavy metal translocating P-type ATPase [Alphaproteobacteria bacterium]
MSAESAPAADFSAFVRHEDDGLAAMNLLVEGIHCGGCVQKIERALQARPEVAQARVNLSTRRLAVRWRGPDAAANDLAAAVAALGFAVVPFDPERAASEAEAVEKELLRALAVAGFAAANVMLLSVSVWAGAVEGMGPATRDLLHWFSALIALPAIAYAARPFYRSAWRALAVRRTNMDVPISVGVALATAMSLFETMRGGEHVYFDSALALVFFLLIGRYLDRRARGKARAAASRLLALRATAATVIDVDGGRRTVRSDALRPGMVVFAAAGERIAVDGRVVEGRSEIDSSLITGESLPATVAAGDAVFAGTINLAAPLRYAVTAVGPDTLLAEIVRLMELAEQRRSRYVDLADRVARHYAPAVHGLALATFLGWTLFSATPWQVALLYAVSVLIITCPCALGLAVPAVQVIASGRLMRRGTLLKSATALERLAKVDTVVFDKTGTLTVGRPMLAEGQAHDPADLALAASLAAASRHPLALALRRAAPEAPVAQGVAEQPGSGLSLKTSAGEIKLGSRRFCRVAEEDGRDGPELWLARPGRTPVRFGFTERLRPDATETIAALKARGLQVEILSGDRRPAVARVAWALGVATWRAGCMPAEKCARLAELEKTGRHVLMVGDGLNDAPALAAASVSLSPSSAIDISQNAADAVFQGEALAPVVTLLDVARRAERLVRQNFGLAFAYNAIAVPLAVLGLVTPLVAALAMSGSSLLVVGNALRLTRGGRR